MQSLQTLCCETPIKQYTPLLANVDSSSRIESVVDVKSFVPLLTLKSIGGRLVKLAFVNTSTVDSELDKFVVDIVVVIV